MFATFSLLLAAASATPDPHPGMIVPFALLLAAIATGPFINKHWWEHHYHHVALGLGTITTLYYVLGLGAGGRMLHVAHEYVSFIALIGSLFVVSGGIHIRVKGEATPLVNAALSDVVPVRQATSMADAVRQAWGLAPVGGTVLLAPACASFDMFRDYAARGEAFVEEVRRLSDGQSSVLAPR